jgi:hypothetical protein
MCSAERKFGMMYISKTETTHAGINVSLVACSSFLISNFVNIFSLNGLIMGFGKISSNELIPADIRHCISVVVNVDVYIFRPPVGSIIEGMSLILNWAI